MIAAALPPPPRWLPARVLLAGLFVAAILSAAGGASFFSAWSQLFESTLLARVARSGLILIAALATATSAGFTITWLAQYGGTVVSRSVSFLGRALALFPVAALAWALVGWWIGVRGLPVETLMPAQFDATVKDAQMAVGIVLWQYLAPALVLAVPLLGEVVAAASVPLRARLQAICLHAPAWLMLVEDVLHFPGLGSWMAQEIRAGEAAHVAVCVTGFTCLSAALCLIARAIPSGQKSGASHLESLCWLPWPLWILALCAFAISESKLWLLMWLALAGMTLPTCLASLRGIDLSRQSRRVAAWSLETLSLLSVWLAATAAVHPRILAGGVMRVFRPLVVTTHAQAAETLTRPGAILHVGAGLLGVALALHLIACALRIGTEKTPS